MLFIFENLLFISENLLFICKDLLFIFENLLFISENSLFIFEKPCKYFSLCFLNMICRQKIDKSTRKTIIKLSEKNLSIRAISKEVNRSKSVVGKDSGRICSPNKRGRPRKTYSREDRIIQLLFASAPSISRQIKNTDNINVSRFTVSKHLNEIGLFAQRPMRKPLISKKNKKKRLDFAYKFVNKHQNWWNKVYFSNESTFNLFGSDGINYVRWFKVKSSMPNA